MRARFAALGLALGLALGWPILGCTPEEEAIRPAGPDVAAPAAATAPDPRTETRKFRDWLAVCDNGDACLAFGGPPDSAAAWVRVSVAPGPGARPNVLAGLGAEGGAPEGPLSLLIDGRRFALTREAGDGGTSRAVGVAEDEDEAAALVASLARARTLSLNLGDQTVALSPRGAAAALLWIDERQGRLDTPTALARRGGRPASTVPAGAPLPPAPVARGQATPLAETRAPAAAERLAEVAECRADIGQRQGAAAADRGWRLPDGRALWVIPCFLGAYNLGQVWTLFDAEGQARVLSLPGSREASSEVVNGAFDPSTLTLTAFAKGRGLGDCGVLSTWIWTGEGFALAAESEMRECWGVPVERWPTTWRTR